MALRSNQSLANLISIIYLDAVTGAVIINTDLGLEVGNTTLTSTINATFFNATANNALYLSGLAANVYVTTGTDSVFNANVTFDANVMFANTSSITSNGSVLFNSNVSFSNTAYLISNGTNLFYGSALFSNNTSFTSNVVFSNTSYTTFNGNATFSNTTTFTSNVVFTNTSSTFYNGNATFANTTTFSSNIILSNTATIVANGQFGSTGQSLISNGTAVYWGTATPANPSPLVFTSSGSNRSVTGYQESGLTYPVRSTAFVGGALQFTLASFTPGLSASINPSSSLNWDVPATGFSVSVTNPTDFTSEYISNVYSITASTGSVSPLSDFTAGSQSPTAAGGVNWSQTFTLGSAHIYSTSTTITGGSASGTISFVANNNGTSSQYTPTNASFSVNWATPSISISTAALSGATFLSSYASTSYTISVSGITTASNYSHAVTGTNATVTNASGSGTLNFTNNIHKDNTGTATTASVTTTFTRPSTVTGTSYTASLSGSSSASASFTYPSVWLFTSSSSNPPARSDIVSGTGFQGTVNILGNQQKTFAGSVTNSQGTPQAFWLAVRASASQPTTFQTGASSALLSGVAYVTSSVALQPDSPLPGYSAETYNLYGITLQPGSTYVSIS